mmetsp:Transcript_27278/g.69372  ORF Transcript_27278/g.69372 Transcript_27278/m.69372 type:complete len:201 (-) Transcript_27278:285-887(-)
MGCGRHARGEGAGRARATEADADAHPDCLHRARGFPARDEHVRSRHSSPDRRFRDHLQPWARLGVRAPRAPGLQSTGHADARWDLPHARRDAAPLPVRPLWPLAARCQPGFEHVRRLRIQHRDRPCDVYGQHVLMRVAQLCVRVGWRLKTGARLIAHGTPGACLPVMLESHQPGRMDGNGYEVRIALQRQVRLARACVGV